MSRLYNNIIKSILRGLNESGIFDGDDILDDIDDLEVANNMDLMTNKLQDLLKETLCEDSAPFHRVESSELCPFILKNPDNSSQYFIAPFRTYESTGLIKHPRKIKKFKYPYFYRYILTFTDTGHIDLSVMKANDKKQFAISNQLYTFLDKTNLKVDRILFHTPDNTATPYSGDILKVFIITPYKTKISDHVINNFPAIEPCGPSLKTKNPNDEGLTRIYKSSCESDESFIILVEKLVNNGFSVVDENKFIYDADNIVLRKLELTSGSQDIQILNEISRKEAYIKEKLGDACYDKLYKIIDYFKSQPISLFATTILNGGQQLTSQILTLRKINTLRTCKIDVLTTIPELRKANNLSNQIDEIKEGVMDRYTGEYFLRMLIYKMLCVALQEQLNNWKIRETFKDCVDGWTVTGFNFCTTKYVNIDSIPIKIDSAAKLYDLYFIIGTALVQGNDLVDAVIQKYKDNNDIDVIFEDGIFYANDLVIRTNILENLSADDVRVLNTDKRVDMDTFNFDILTEQLQIIIIKTCKKYKLK